LRHRNIMMWLILPVSLRFRGDIAGGYNDNTCPLTSMHSAYNVINAPKELHLFQETQHRTFPEQQEMRNNWLLQKLLK